MAITPPDTQYEIVEHHIDLGDRVALTPMRLPAGWVPLLATRRESLLVVLLVREVAASGGSSWPYELLAATGSPAGEGEAAFGSADQANPLELWVAAVDGAGVDHGVDLAALVEGSVLRLVDAGDSEVWQEYMCRAAPEVVGGVALFDDPIHWNASGLLSVPSAVSLTVSPPQAAASPA